MPRKTSPRSTTVTKEPRNLNERRRDQIVRAAVQLFSDHGYFPTTIEDIANEVKVSKGLIYLYFKDKNDLLFYALRFVLERYATEVLPKLRRTQNPLVALRGALRAYCRLVNDYRFETELAYRATRDLPRKQRLNIKVEETKIWRVFRNYLEACIHRGFMVPVNLDIMAYQYIMLAHQWALKNWAFRDKYAFEDYLADGEKILIDNFLTKEGRKLSEEPPQP
jgi:AcrR family transcriptional regulator